MVGRRAVSVDFPKICNHHHDSHLRAILVPVNLQTYGARKRERERAEERERERERASERARESEREREKEKEREKERKREKKKERQSIHINISRWQIHL